MHRLDRLPRHVHQHYRGSLVVTDRMINDKGRLDRMASQVGKRIGNRGDSLGIDILRRATVRDPKHQPTAVSMVGKRQQALGEPILVIAQRCLSVLCPQSSYLWHADIQTPFAR